MDRELFPQPGDRRQRDHPRRHRHGTGRLVQRAPARDRRLHLDRLGLPRRGRHRPDRTTPTTPTSAAGSGRRTRGCSPGAATSTSPVTGGPRRTTARSCSGCAPSPTWRSTGRSTTACDGWNALVVERRSRQLDLGRARGLAGHGGGLQRRRRGGAARQRCAGRSRSGGARPRFRSTFEIEYRPGTLTAVAYAGA